MNTEKPNFLFMIEGLTTQVTKRITDVPAEAWCDEALIAFLKNLVKQASIHEQMARSKAIDESVDSASTSAQGHGFWEAEIA